MITNCRCCMKNYCTQNFTIQVVNQGTFTARVSVSYFNQGHFIADSSGPLLPGFVYTDNLQPTCYNIVLRIYNISVDPIQIIRQEMYQHPQNVQIILVD